MGQRLPTRSTGPTRFIGVPSRTAPRVTGATAARRRASRCNWRGNQPIGNTRWRSLYRRWRSGTRPSTRVVPNAMDSFILCLLSFGKHELIARQYRRDPDQRIRGGGNLRPYEVVSVGVDMSESGHKATSTTDLASVCSTPETGQARALRGCQQRAQQETHAPQKRPQTSPQPSLSGLRRRTLRSPTVLIPHITPRAVVCTPTVIVIRSAVVTIAGAMGGDAGHYSTDHRTSNYSARGTGTPTTPTAPPA